MREEIKMPQKAHFNVSKGDPQKRIFWPQKSHFPDFPMLTSVGGPCDRSSKTGWGPIRSVIWRSLIIFGPLGRHLSGVAPANQTKERSVHELFTGAFRNKSSMWIVLVFLRKNTRIHKNGRNSWTFRFGPFFGLVCRGASWIFGPLGNVNLGDRFLSSAGAGEHRALSVMLSSPSPVLDKSSAPLGPDILFSTGAGFWRKAPMAFSDSSSVLDNALRECS